MKLADNVFLRDDHNAVVIIDQTLLPGREQLLELESADQMVEAIYRLRVRGAPAIGICAGYCLYVLARGLADKPYTQFVEGLRAAGAKLAAARPTAVNLEWALNRMEQAVVEAGEKPVAQLVELLEQESADIQREDIAMCQAIARHGLTLLREGSGVLTHCNAGPLATSRYGTALGPILMAAEQGMNIRVFADETRPLLQGARLTAYELHKAGVDITLICDNMAASVMAQGWVDACFVGCDRVAANGDVANKIGTSGVAILAKHYGVPVYVLGPTSTIDWNCPTGADIHIELRDPEEIRTLHYREPMAPAGVKCYNPAFDVTDHDLIAGIITEHGICRPPFEINLPQMCKQQ